MSTEKPMEVKLREAFDEQIAAGVTEKSEVAIAMHNATGCGISAAINAYNKFGKETGLVLSTEERNKQMGATIAGFAVEGQEFDRTAARDALTEQFGITGQTASQHIRSWCAENGVELPSASSAKASAEEIKAVVESMHAEEKTRDEIIAHIASTYDYSESTAGTKYRKAAVELGISSPGTTGNREALIKYLVDYGDTVDRSSMIKALQDNFGIAPATAVTYYSNFLFAKQYHAVAVETGK